MLLKTTPKQIDIEMPINKFLNTIPTAVPTHTPIDTPKNENCPFTKTPPLIIF